MDHWLRWFLLGMGALLGSCAQGPSPLESELAEGVVARVGQEVVRAETVARIARANARAPAEAQRDAVFDAILAEQARQLFGPAVVSYLRRLALGRRLSEKLLSEARAMGPITDAELERATRRRWWELDRPDGVRSIHAVVVVEDESDDTKARRVAERIAAAVAGENDAARFRELALAVDAAGLSVKVEELPVIFADGRGVNLVDPPEPGTPPLVFAAEYAQAANQLKAVGDQSPVVRSQFGYHIIMLTEHVPGSRLSIDERRERVRADVEVARARALEADILQRVTQDVGGVELNAQADSLTAVVQVR